MDRSFLEENGIDVNAGLELLGDMDMYNETMGDFLEEINEKLPKLIEYKNNNDMPNYAIIVHSIKSDSKYLGFTKLAELAYNHEMKSKANDTSYVNANYDELQKEIDRIIKIIKEYLGYLEVFKFMGENLVLMPDVREQTILVVDDSNITRSLIERVYKDQYKILMASNGREAIDIVDTMPEGVIVAILLDLNMPDLDGFAVLDHFKEKDLFNKIPVSIITGDSSKETINRCLSYNIVDILIKPFSGFDIERVVAKMVK